MLMAYPSRLRYHRGSAPIIPVMLCYKMRIWKIRRSSLLTRAMTPMPSGRTSRIREVLRSFQDDQIARNSLSSIRSSIPCATRSSDVSISSRMPDDWQLDMIKRPEAIWASFTSYQQGFGSNSLSTEPIRLCLR